MRQSDPEKIKKQGTVSGGLYIALAICILSVICVGVYSAIVNIVKTGVSDRTTVPAPSSKNPTPGVIVEAPSDPEPGKKPAKEGIFPTLPGKEASVEPGETAEEPDDPDEPVIAPLSEPTSFTRPTGGSVIKGFSDDVLVYSATMNDYRVHRGLDIQAGAGDPVSAFADGVVEKIEEDALMGWTVVLRHGGELKSIYQNLSDFVPAGIEVGATVREGQVIGAVGDSSLIECAEEIHLHFEVEKNGEKVDPESFFR